MAGGLTPSSLRFDIPYQRTLGFIFTRCNASLVQKILIYLWIKWNIIVWNAPTFATMKLVTNKSVSSFFDITISLKLEAVLRLCTTSIKIRFANCHKISERKRKFLSCRKIQFESLFQNLTIRVDSNQRETYVNLETENEATFPRLTIASKIWEILLIGNNNHRPRQHRRTT